MSVSRKRLGLACTLCAWTLTPLIVLIEQLNVIQWVSGGLVPIQQAQLIVEKLKKAGVTSELLTRVGRGHDLNGLDSDVVDMTNWFDKYLKK